MFSDRLLDSVVGICGPIYSQIRTSQMKDIAKKDLVGYGVSLMGGGGACKRVGAGHSTPDHQHSGPRANGYPRLAHHRPIQSVYWHCPER